MRVALAQLAAIMAGILGAAAGSKFVQVAGHDLPLPTAFMMTYGWVLLPLPLVWIIIAICVKDHPRVSESARRTCFALGVALLLGLCACAVFSSVAPWRQIGDAAPLAAPSPRPELP